MRDEEGMHGVCKGEGRRRNARGKEEEICEGMKGRLCGKVQVGGKREGI